jgi:hypothetical protein
MHDATKASKGCVVKQLLLHARNICEVPEQVFVKCSRSVSWKRFWSFRRSFTSDSAHSAASVAAFISTVPHWRARQLSRDVPADACFLREKAVVCSDSIKGTPASIGAKNTWYFEHTLYRRIKYIHTHTRARAHTHTHTHTTFVGLAICEIIT